jgi:nucleoside 2-deoxyribosyltransferase
MQKVYLAAPLFGITERRTNRLIAEAIARHMPDIDIVLPQDLKFHHRYNDRRAFGVIFKACIEAVDRAAAVVAVLDGADSESGTAFEVGYAYAKGIPVIAVRTDYRANQQSGLNLMLARGCAALVYRPAFDEDIDALGRDIARALQRVLKKHPPARTSPATSSAASSNR